MHIPRSSTNKRFFEYSHSTLKTYSSHARLKTEKFPHISCQQQKACMHPMHSLPAGHIYSIPFEKSITFNFLHNRAFSIFTDNSVVLKLCYKTKTSAICQSVVLSAVLQHHAQIFSLQVHEESGPVQPFSQSEFWFSVSANRVRPCWSSFLTLASWFRQTSGQSRT